jgi:hypothetical protein
VIAVADPTGPPPLLCSVLTTTTADRRRHHHLHRHHHLRYDVYVPDTTYFVGGGHNTSEDTVEYVFMFFPPQPSASD